MVAYPAVGLENNAGQASISADLVASFRSMKKVDIIITSVELLLRTDPQKSLQVERPNAYEASHTSGNDANVTVEGFIGRKIGDLVLEKTQEHKDELCTSPWT